MIETHVLNPSVTEIYSTTQPIETAHKSPQMLQESLTSAVIQLETVLQDKLEKLLSKQEYQLLKIGENINSLTQELEQAISEFLQISQQANKTYSSLQFLGQFVEQCAQLLHPAPNFLTAFSGEEVKPQKMFSFLAAA